MPSRSTGCARGGGVCLLAFDAVPTPARHGHAAFFSTLCFTFAIVMAGSPPAEATSKTVADPGSFSRTCRPEKKETRKRNMAGFGGE